MYSFKTHAFVGNVQLKLVNLFELFKINSKKCHSMAVTHLRTSCIMINYGSIPFGTDLYGRDFFNEYIYCYTATV